MTAMLGQYEQNMEGIENCTLEYQNGEENSYNIYYERFMKNGHPVYQIAEISLSDKLPKQQATIRSNNHAFIRKLQFRALITGTKSVGGHQVYVITVNDVSNLSLSTGDDMAMQAYRYVWEE